MEQKNSNFAKQLEELKKLNLPKEKFAVFGSGPMAIRNLRESRDIDIIVTQEVWNKLAEKYPISSKERAEGGIMKKIQVDEIEIYGDWPPFESVEKLIKEADIINGFRFVKLGKVLLWKKYLNREKDRQDILLIEEYLESRAIYRQSPALHTNQE